MDPLISANQGAGISLTNGATQNQILGNFIGTDISGEQEVGNLADGISLSASSNNTIGGPVGDFRTDF
jgi:hypothetical protein